MVEVPKSTTIALADYDKLVALLRTAFDGTAQQGSTLPILYDAREGGKALDAALTDLYRKADDAVQKGYTILPEHLRDEIASTGAVIFLHAIRDGETKFGPTWFTDIEYRGELWTMPQSHNEMRDRFMLNAIEYTKAFGPLPAVIEAFSAKGGDGWDFAPPPAEYMQALASGTGEIGGSDTVQAGQDDLPRDFTDVPF